MEPRNSKEQSWITQTALLGMAQTIRCSLEARNLALTVFIVHIMGNCYTQVVRFLWISRITTSSKVQGDIQVIQYSQ